MAGKKTKATSELLRQVADALELVTRKTSELRKAVDALRSELKSTKSTKKRI